MTDARGKYLGITSEMISADEAARLMPIIDPGQFAGAMYDAEHGHVDPTGVTYAYARAAMAAGAQVRRRTWARRIERTADGQAWRIGLYDTSGGDLAGTVARRHRRLVVPPAERAQRAIATATTGSKPRTW